jgi:hypothetical protein
MKRLILSSLLLCNSVGVVRAQQNISSGIPSSSNIAADFTATSAARVPLVKPLQPTDALFTSAALDLASPAAASSATVATVLVLPIASNDSSFADPSYPLPAARLPRLSRDPRIDYRWELALGVSLERFRSSIYRATGVGTYTSLTYYRSGWLGIEGDVNTFFAPSIWNGEHIKLVNYGAGPKIAWRESPYEPFVHILVGGTHALPQTANGGRNGFALQFGGGADLRLFPRFSVRGEVDYVPTKLFGEWQHNVQLAIAGVLHF